MWMETATGQQAHFWHRDPGKANGLFSVCILKHCDLHDDTCLGELASSDTRMLLATRKLRVRVPVIPNCNQPK